MNESRPPHRFGAQTKPAKTPHLHVRSVEGLLGEAVAITGNAKAHFGDPPQPRVRVSYFS